MSSNISLLLTLTLAAFTKVSVGLRLTELVVPGRVRLGTSQIFSCGFILERAKLYSVKWYKDDFEFYRFMPDNRPQIKVFPVNGISLDESLSDMHRVALMRLDTNSSGVYRCEVSTEGPNFDTVVSNANLSVYSFPDRDPEITVTKSYYSTAEYVSANCSSGLSYPPARLTWFVNNMKVGKGSWEGLERVGEVFRSWSSLSLKGEEMDTADEGHVTLGCQASVPHDRSRRTSLRVSLDQTQALTNLRLQQTPPRPNTHPQHSHAPGCLACGAVTLYCVLILFCILPL